MAIKSNKSIDFEYEFEMPNGALTSFSLRFYYTEEYGPTLAVLDEEGEPAINFPVTMFSEVTDFLQEQGIIEGKKIHSLPQVPTKLSKPNIAGKPLLPKPKLVTSRPAQTVNPLKVGNKKFNAVELDIDSDEPDEQPYVPEDLIAKEKNRLAEISAAVEGSVPSDALSTSAEQASALSDEELAEILAQRQQAVKKVDKAGKVLRRKEE